MNVLFLGDLVGERVIIYIKHTLKDIKRKYKIDVVIANGENVADGYGIKPSQCEELIEYGVDVITSGNHIWDQAEILPYIAKNNKILRPINYKTSTPGNGHIRYESNNGKIILVINLICNLFMRTSSCPFEAVKEVLNNNKLKTDCDIILVDLHGEAASEKQALANMIDGRVTAVLGTHTHVPTSDLRILPNGTTFITDAGMCGDYDSVIGGKKESWINKFEKKDRLKISSANKNSTICGVIIKASKDTGLTQASGQIILGNTLENKIPDDKYFYD